MVVLQVHRLAMHDKQTVGRRLVDGHCRKILRTFQHYKLDAIKDYEQRLLKADAYFRGEGQGLYGIIKYVDSSDFVKDYSGLGELHLFITPHDIGLTSPPGRTVLQRECEGYAQKSDFAIVTADGLLRLDYKIMHEMGHILGTRHHKGDENCIMNETIQSSSPLRFCPDCLDQALEGNNRLAELS